MSEENEFDNPMQLDGLEFIEFASPNSELLADQLARFGLTPVKKHKTKAITLYQAGEVRFILNAEPGAAAAEFVAAHGPAASAMGFRVKDARFAYERAVSLGAKPCADNTGYPDLPAIYGIGGSIIYFVDTYGDKTIYDNDFVDLPLEPTGFQPTGVYFMDHLTHNVHRGNMDVWALDFYGKIFNFREIRYFDIKGQQTGLISRALRSPCNGITIPINEGTDSQSQIEEYLREFNGEGIQHIALSCRDIYTAVEALKANGISFMTPPPDTYYEMLQERLPGHGEDIKRLQELAILVDGSIAADGSPKLLLQIFTENMMGPAFFEIIQRKGDEGFGEGNFSALFESIERDQIRRGVLKPVAAE